MLSPTGRSRMWDENADGYARGEGIASVVLKTLSSAMRNGDHIECIIRETGLNQDGRTTGITMPSNAAQTDLIRQTYARAGLDPDNTHDRPQFFHAHGTGTPAGDPQEAEAISRAFFSRESSNESKLYVGSIKTIIGHTEGTAGLASLIGASLAVQNGIIPPNMHFGKLSDKVAPFYHNLTESKPWPTVPHGHSRRVSVNSFGMFFQNFSFSDNGAEYFQHYVFVWPMWKVEIYSLSSLISPHDLNGQLLLLDQKYNQIRT